MKLMPMTLRGFVQSLTLALAALLLAGCETLQGPLDGGTPDSAGAAPMVGGINRLQVGDLVRVEFQGTIQLIPPHEEHIKEDGSITLNLLGKVQAAGKTTGELQSAIHDAYVPKFYRHLTVTVRGADLVYYVGGEVKAPGRQPYLGPVTVTGAIKSAGDFTDFAKKTQVELTRANGEKHIINANKARQKPDLDLPVYPGDQVNVPKSIW